MSSTRRCVRIRHRATGRVLAEGPLGWGITPFEGNLYIRRRYLRTPFRPTFVPGLCPYKGLYVWAEPAVEANPTRLLGWIYWLPNPLLPFIWYRVGLPREHPALVVEELPAAGGPSHGGSEERDAVHRRSLLRGCGLPRQASLRRPRSLG